MMRHFFLKLLISLCFLTSALAQGGETSVRDDATNILVRVGKAITGGQIRLNALSTPVINTVVPQGTTGSTTYTYFIVAEDSGGFKTLASAGGQTTIGNATLNGTNFNRITWFAVPGAKKYYILKTNTSTQLGTTQWSGVVAAALTFDDTGQATTGFTAPTRNSTADVTVSGMFTGINLLHNSVFNNESLSGLYIKSVDANGNKGLILGADNANAISYIQAVSIGTSYSSPLVLNAMGGNVSIGTTAQLGQLGIISASASTKGLVVRAASAHTVTTLEIQDSAGNVAAGAAPLAITDVPDSTYGQINLYANSGRSQFISFTESGLANNGSIGFAAGSSTMHLRTGGTPGTDRISIDSTGLMGINKPTSIGAQLHLVTGSASRIAERVDSAASQTADLVNWTYNGTMGGKVVLKSDLSNIAISGRDLGNNKAAPSMTIGANSNAGAEGGTAGTQEFVLANFASRYVWVDNSGNMRIHSAAPTGSTGTPTVNGESAGVVVGTQTSVRASKDFIHPYIHGDESLKRVLATPLYTFKRINEIMSFGRAGAQWRHGFMADDQPYWMMYDKRSVDQYQISMDIIAAFRELEKRVSKIEKGRTQ